MPLKLAVRGRARRDLEAIVSFIAERNRDMTVAQHFGRRLLDRCHDLVAAPGMGRPYLQRGDMRKLVEGNYKIFYRVTSTQMIVLRIWDGRRGHEPVL